MIPLNANGNVDNSDLVNYPDGRIRDNDGTNNGTGVNRSVYGDLHSNISKLMRLYAITPSGLPDNENNGFQLIESLRALASKNDFIYPLSTNGTILSVDIKFSQMLDNEYILCLAAFNKAAETQIKGIGAGTFTITYSGNFKTNEYVRVIKTSGGVSIIRVADAVSLDAMVADALYLKKASQAEENAGSIDTVATTPKVNKITYALRTIGTDSGNYLAKPTGDPDERNGLMSKEDKAIVDGFVNKVKNVGWFSGLDIAGTPIGTPLAVNGDITAAVTFSSGTMYDESFVLVTMANTMANINYFVRSFPESQSTLNVDNDIYGVVFKPVSTTQFQIAIKEASLSTNSIKLHLEVVQL